MGVLLGGKKRMLERWTAFLAQSAATILVLTGLVVLLAFTHMKTYRAGYCAASECDATQQLQPASSAPVQQSGDRYVAETTSPAIESRPGAVVAAASQPSVSTAIEPAQSSGSQGNQQPTGGQGLRPSGPPRPARAQDPGELICYDAPPSATDQDIARCWLRIGDAYQAIDMTDEARAAWDEALVIGSEVGGAQASLMAQQRLQGAVLERSCRTTEASLRRIANGYDRSDVDGEIINLTHRQSALAALGYYSDAVDGQYGPATRRAVRDFQADMGFDQTGALNPQETVDLVCHAAVTARDADAQNLLGIMFATGLGVELNVDMATEWLEIAATREHAEANYNLALIYGTGTIQGSYRLCGVVESPERADSYLRRASDLGHYQASMIRRVEGTRGSPAARWQRIGTRLAEQAEREEDRFYKAWLDRVDEARRHVARGTDQPGCYLRPPRNSDRAP